MTPQDISDPSHWGRHAVEPVNLPLALEAMLDAYALSLGDGGGEGSGGGGGGEGGKGKGGGGGGTLHLVECGDGLLSRLVSEWLASDEGEDGAAPPSSKGGRGAAAVAAAAEPAGPTEQHTATSSSSSKRKRWPFEVSVVAVLPREGGEQLAANASGGVGSGARGGGGAAAEAEARLSEERKQAVLRASSVEKLERFVAELA